MARTPNKEKVAFDSSKFRGVNPEPMKRPFMPSKYTKKDVLAIQSLAAGVANSDQQKQALYWIINIVADTYGLPYYPDSQSDKDFAMGKMFVGQQIVKMLKVHASKIKEKEDNV